MKVLIFGSKDHGSKNDPVAIADSVRTDEVLSEVVYWEDLVFHIKTGKVFVTHHGENIFANPVGLIIGTGWYKAGYRDVAYALALVARSLDINIWNSEMAQQRSTSKLSCLVQLALQNINVPETVFSLGDTDYISTQPLPFIAKAPAASRGSSNYFVNSDEERQNVLRTSTKSAYLVQPFLPNDHDLRVICFDGTPQLVLKRSRAGDSESHLNNTSQGGTSEWLDLSQVPAELLTISKKICTVMAREMAGIDFIPDAGSPYQYSCLEVNAIPQLTSGVDVDKKMAALKIAVNRLKERT